MLIVRTFSSFNAHIRLPKLDFTAKEEYLKAPQLYSITYILFPIIQQFFLFHLITPCRSSVEVNLEYLFNHNCILRGIPKVEIEVMRFHCLDRADKDVSFVINVLESNQFFTLQFRKIDCLCWSDDSWRRKYTQRIRK